LYLTSGKSVFAAALIRHFLLASTVNKPQYLIYENRDLKLMLIIDFAHKVYGVYKNVKDKHLPMLDRYEELDSLLVNPQNLWIIDGYESLELSESIKNCFNSTSP